MRNLILTIFILAIQFADGQNVYNFNNKYTIGYANNLLYRDKNSINIGPNQHQFVLQKILTRKFSLILNYTFSKNTTNLIQNTSPVFVLKSVDSNGNNLYYSYLTPSGTAIIRTNIINLGFRTFIRSKGAIAPFGHFFEFKVGYAHIFNKPEEDHVVYHDWNDRTLKNELPVFGINHLNVLSLQTGFGASKPIVKNLYFDWLFNLNLNIPLWTGRIKETEVYHQDIYFYRNARILYGTNNRARLNFGIHYGF